MGWEKAVPKNRPWQYECPNCHKIVYWCGDECGYRYCGHCGKDINPPKGTVDCSWRLP